MMFRLLLISLLFTACVMKQNAQSLFTESLLWKNRVVLVFAPSTNHQDYNAQFNQYKNHKAAWEERDLVFYTILPDQIINGNLQIVHNNQAAKLREQYGIESGQVTFVLLGKDGGVKLKEVNKQVDNQQLFALIDGMPMRRQEIRERKQ